jgi:CRP/FNR family transcriptional regulator, cyclic AMP receptor protein
LIADDDTLTFVIEDVVWMTIAGMSLNQFLTNARWAQGLEKRMLEAIAAEVTVRRIEAGGFVCRRGETVETWIGVVHGLAKIANVSATGRAMTFTGITEGGWFGEGSLLKDATRKYDAVAVRTSEVAYMPKQRFFWLLDHHLPFNRFLIEQLNERLGQFLGMVEHERLLGPEGRVARAIAGLFNPLLYPNPEARLNISQEEIGYFAGVSRQRANRALKVLAGDGLIRLEYGGLVVLNVDGLRAYTGAADERATHAG